MELIARLADREEALEVERVGALYRVRIGDRVYEIDATASGDRGRSFLIEGVQHELSVQSLGNGRYEVSSAHGLTEVRVEDPLTHLARAARGDSREGSAATVKAYMPGRVVAVLAAEGEAVEAGQGVLVLEAMKMENEIQAERAGVVRRVFVEPGQAIEGGDPLFELE